MNMVKDEVQTAKKAKGAKTSKEIVDNVLEGGKATPEKIVKKSLYK